MFDTQDKLYEKALDDGLASLKYSPFRANYYTDVAETYLNLNRPADAISILRKMQRLQSNPESDVLCACDAAKAYKTLKQYDNAVNVLSAVIKAYPKNATLYGARGDAYDAAKNDKAAIADYQKAAALEPKKSIYLKYIGNIYLHSKEYDKAIAQYKLAIAAEPHSANGALGMARAYQDMKKYAEALTWCNKALTIAPKYSIIFYTKARILLESGDYRGQLQALNEGVKLSPDDSDFYRSRAMCQLRNIHWKEAYQDADKAVSVDQSCDNYVVRCQVAIALGLMQYAVDDANYALSTACPNPDPDMNAYLQIISATTYTQLKQRDKAAAVLALKPTQTTWPYPIVEWMQGKRSFDSLVATASDNDKKTELYYYLGLKEQADGDNVKAKQHFDWVNKNGTQSYYETTVANALLHNSRTEAQSIVKSISRTIPGIK